MEENNQNLNQHTIQNLQEEQALASPTATPLPTQPKSKLPIIIIGIIVFSLLIGGIFVFLFFPKSDTSKQSQTKTVLSPQPTLLQETPIPSTLTPDITGWKTFTNSVYSISYPSTFTEHEIPAGNLFELYSPDYADDGGYPTITDGFRITVCVKSNCIPSFEEYAKQELNNPPFQKVEKIMWLNTPSTVYKRDFNQISYDIFPDNSASNVSVSIVTPLQGGEEIFNTNKKLIYQIANTLKLK